MEWLRGEREIDVERKRSKRAISQGGEPVQRTANLAIMQREGNDRGGWKGEWKGWKKWRRRRRQRRRRRRRRRRRICYVTLIDAK